MATDIFDELLNPPQEAGIPQAELIQSLRRQRQLGQVASLSGDKNIARLGGKQYDDAMTGATDLRDRRDRETRAGEQRAFMKWQQDQAIADRQQARTDKRDYQDRALRQAREIADARIAAQKGSRANQSEFQKNYDRKTGIDAQAWDSGGETHATGALKDVTDAIAMLQDPKLGELGSSKWTLLPGGDNIRRLVDPTGTKVQQLSNRVTVQNLRETFGPQFTQQEGERYQALDYDPALSDEVNLKNLQTKQQIIQEQIQKKNALFNKYREGTTPSNADGSINIDLMDDNALADHLINSITSGAE